MTDGDANTTREMKVKAWAKTSLFLTFALLVLALSQVAGLGMKTLHFFRTANGEHEDPCDFDSFSEAGVAMTVINQEANRLLLAYTEAQPAAQVEDPRLSGSESFSRDALQVTAKAVAEMHQAVRGLSTGLDRRFLRVYSQQGAAEAFLDCYLALLNLDPGTPDVVTWEWSALNRSWECGRTEELVDALQHAIRFHPELKTSHGLGETLDSWAQERTAVVTSIH